MVAPFDDEATTAGRPYIHHARPSGLPTPLMLKTLRPIIKPFLRPALANFKSALQRPDETQQLVLQKLVAKLATTEYGRHFHLKAKDDYQTFAAKLPLVTYDDLSDWITRQQQSEKNVLVAEAVQFYEKTSGSAAAAKFIPYTPSLKASFNRMFVIWLADLLENLPQLATGKTFFSVSPTSPQRSTTGRGKAIGLADDAHYLHRWLQRLCKPFFVVPPALKGLQEAQNFQRALAVLLLAEEKLEILSLWNPSLFDVLLEFIQANREMLHTDLRSGVLHLENLTFRFPQPNDKRLARLAAAEISWPHLWPEIKLISCWTSAQAKQAAARLAAKFPHAFMQGKGLLATEAPMTLPLIEARGFAPLLTEVFFEFLDAQDRLRRLSELEVGQEYEIVLTQAGGLSRYRLGDGVRVTHWYAATPCLEFTGRKAAVCDLTGEKLNDQFVQNCLTRLALQSVFQVLLPVADDKPYYALLTDSLRLAPCADAAAATAALETQLDSLLREAYHYDQARRLGQLQAARLVVVAEARTLYFDYFVAKGLQLGNIKAQALLVNLADAANLLRRLAVVE